MIILSFLSTSLIMTAVILLVFLINGLLSHRIQAKFRYAVWVIVLIGLFIPLRPVVGDGLFKIPVYTDIQTSAEVPVFTEISTENLQRAFEISPLTIVVIIWAAVAVSIFIYHILRYNKFIRVVRRWGKPVEDEETLKIFQSVLNEKGIKEIEIVRCNIVSTSMLTGFLKPVIILPDKELTAEELEMVFRHELIHYKRGDLYIKLISSVSLAIHWFNPAVYHMCSAIQTECEASCDEAVLQEMGESSKLYYAELIVEMVGKKRTSTMLSTCFYGGQKSLKRRLNSIMDGGTHRKTAYVALVFIFMLSVMSGSVFAFSPREIPIFDATDRSVRPENPPISFTRAVEIAQAHTRGKTGYIDEISMDFENGQWVWEIDFDFADGTELEVSVCVATGDVISIDWDD